MDMQRLVTEGNTRERIVVVDDERVMRELMRDVLVEEFEVQTADGVASARPLIESGNVDLIVSDIRMPVASGVDLLQWCHDAGRKVPVILVSGYSDGDLIMRALNLGARHLLSKPFTPDALLGQVREVLASQRLEKLQARFMAQLQENNRQLEENVQLRTQELALTQEVTINALARLAETRDPETGAHLERTRRYVKLLAEWLAANGSASYVLSSDRIDLVYRTAPLHDIGKVGVPDSILLKPGKLTPEEFEVMKKHTLFGYNALHLAAEGLGTTTFLTVACEITLQHHERWDGKGYPSALAGERIALSARLMALADVYDALISKRCYKEPMPPEKATG